MNDSVREVLENLNAIHCLPVNTRFENRVDALRAAVSEILTSHGDSIDDDPVVAPSA